MHRAHNCVWLSPALNAAHLSCTRDPDLRPGPPCWQVLVIIAASHLDAVTFQICSQSFKIMPTALFAVWLLGQHLAPIQWASLPVLAVGVVFVTMNNSANASPSDATKLHLLMGLGASALSGLSSAYAGEPQILKSLSPL